MKQWCVYILRCADGTLYTGSTDDFPRRLAAHSSGRGAKYTRGRGPLEPVYREDCADRSAALRREAGLSQAELAQRLQVSPSALGMYEQERREPSMQTLVKLSRELGVTTDYLLTGTPAEKERAELEGMLLGRIRAADQRLEQRRERPFSREELAVLFAAMLMEE